MRLALFDLDHTLLSGDSDVLWCDFLIAQGLVNATQFAARNADMETRYQAGTVGVQEFADFYVGTLAGRTALEWESLRQVFFTNWVKPRVPQKAIDLVNQHRQAGDLLVMTTATNRFITELTAAYFQIPHLIATEPQLVDGRFTGQTTGTLNMREGKVTRLHAWLAARGAALDGYASTAYSDSINDLPLLQAVDTPVAVNPDAKLLAIAQKSDWRVIYLR
jgi:HAD superfamily hydrolase (TIGR01490 family)